MTENFLAVRLAPVSYKNSASVFIIVTNAAFCWTIAGRLSKIGITDADLTLVAMYHVSTVENWIFDASGRSVEKAGDVMFNRAAGSNDFAGDSLELPLGPSRASMGAGIR